MNTQKINKIVKTDIKEGLKQIFPQIFEDNKINFDKLRALLSGEIIEKEDDRFYFNWAGKSNLYKIIQSPAYGTLKPDKERSVDFDNTENIVIVGENLETLKLLLKPYFGKVKMIYIDPPYNTGKDFIYRDNFTQPLKDYLEKTGQIDSEGKKLTTNTEASGRYHSDWLNFMYPRLFLARSLLRDDGVIFVSIDDHEVHHLRMIMDEIFGEENFIEMFSWMKTETPSNLGYKTKKALEYVLCYQKQKDNKKFLALSKKSKSDNPLIKPQNSEKVLEFKKEWLKIGLTDGEYKKGIYGTDRNKVELLNDFKVVNGVIDRDIKIKGRFIWTQEKLEKEIENGTEIRIKTKTMIVNYEKKEYEPESPWNIIDPRFNVETNEDAEKQLRDLFGKKVYDYPKPTSLIKYLSLFASEKNSIILDFFAGSGTTGHAVWDLNKEDGGNRKFILVQLDEEVQDEEIKKEFPTVADICIERLRRVSEKYKKEREEQLIKNEMDFGFKVFKLGKSNFNLKDEFEFDPSEDKEELKKKYLEWLGMFVDQPLVSGWKEIDVIYEVMLKEGLNLNSKIEKVKIKNDEFYYVKDEGQNLEFYISLKDKFSKDTIEEIRTSKYKGKMFVFLDNALTDSDKINLSAFVRLKVI
jgi:adenine-specific DNA-methyltransferase